MFDIHCHILPGVDDGARTPAETSQMLSAARKAGITHIVCTPHCRFSSFNPHLIQQQFRAFSAHACKMGIQATLGYEVHWKKLAELGIETAPQFCIGSSNLFLLEFSDAHLPANWQRTIYSIQRQGLTVIIAHPERYKPVQDNLDLAYEMKDMGCRLQLSANFVEGGFFDKRHRTAKALLKEGLVDYLASDAHRPEHYAIYTKALAEARKY